MLVLLSLFFGRVLKLLLFLLLFLKSINDTLYIGCDQNIVPKSSSVDLKSVSVFSCGFVSLSCECIMVSKFCSVGVASKVVYIE